MRLHRRCSLVINAAAFVPPKTMPATILTLVFASAFYLPAALWLSYSVAASGLLAAAKARCMRLPMICSFVGLIIIPPQTLFVVGILFAGFSSNFANMFMSLNKKVRARGQFYISYFPL